MTESVVISVDSVALFAVSVHFRIRLQNRTQITCLFQLVPQADPLRPVKLFLIAVLTDYVVYRHIPCADFHILILIIRQTWLLSRALVYMALQTLQDELISNTS